MDSLEPGTQSFIVKVWVEDSTEKEDYGVWRGHITHVSSGKRHYMKNLDEIQSFIAPYLEEMGVQIRMHSRVGKWLKRLIS